MKKCIIYILLICLLINCIPLQLLAEEHLYEINTPNQVDNKESASMEAIDENNAISILEHKHKFSELNDVEKMTLSKFFGTEVSLMEKCNLPDYTLINTIDLAVEISNYKYKLAQEQRIYKDQQGKTGQSSVQSDFSQLDVDIVIGYVAEGHKLEDVVNVWKVSKLLDIDMSKIIKKDAAKLQLDTKKVQKADVNIVQDLFAKYPLDFAAIDQYRQRNSLTWQAIYKKIFQLEDTNKIALAGKSLSGDEQSKKTVYDEYFRDIFSYKQNDYEQISLNSGNLTYKKSILSLPGRNGLDLNLNIQYKSSDAELNRTSYTETGNPALEPYTMVGMVYAYLYNPSIGWTSYDISQLELEETVAIQHGWFFESSMAVAMWEGKTFYLKDFLPDHTDLLVEYVATMSKDYEQTTIIDDQTYPVIPQETNNYLAAGWSFNLPSVKLDNWREPVSLNLGDGTSYAIDVVGLIADLSDEANGLADYSLTDMKLRLDIDSFSNGDESSFYALTYKNGDKLYFGENGNLIGHVDRYGNAIKYFYDFNSVEIFGDLHTIYTLNKIEDTLGRITTINYEDLTETRTVTIIPPDHKAIVIQLEKIDGSSLHTLKSIKEPSIPATVFEYDIQSAAFAFTDRFERSENNIYVNLTNVTYPTGGSSHYTYEKVATSLGYVGSYEQYRIKTREDIADNKHFNEDTYIYYENYSGYPYSIKFSQYKDNGYFYGTTVAHSDGTQNVYFFNGLHLNSSASVKNTTGGVLQKTAYLYDIHKLPVKQTDTKYDDGSSINTISEQTWKYNDYSDLLTYTDPLGHKTEYTYEDKFHQVTKQSKQMDANTAQVTDYVIDPVTGNLKQAIQQYTKNNEPASINMYYSYDSYGNPTNIKLEREDGTFIETRYEYGSNYHYGYLTKKSVDTTDYQGSKETASESYTYDFNTGRSLSKTTGNQTTSYLYDDAGRLLKETYPDNSFKSIAYDDVNNIITLTTENGHVVKSIYDDLGSAVERQELRGSEMIPVEKAEYNALGQLAWTEDAKGNRTKYEYDDLGRVIKVINPDDTYAQTKYYDGQNKKVEINEESAEHVYYYNKLGSLVREDLKNGADIYTGTYNYDYAGNLVYQKDSKGNETSFVYDELNRLTTVINPLNEKTFYEYDNLGNNTKVMQQEYDSAGQLSRLITTQKKYDELGRITQTTDPLNKSEYYKYDLFGNLKYKKDKNEQTINYTYDNRNRILTQTAKDVNGATDDYTSYDYSKLYDENKLTILHNGQTTISSYYSNGQLMKEEIQPDNKITQYEYDINGNRSKLIDPFGLTVDYQYDSRNRLDLLTINNEKTFDYDYYDDGMIRSLKYPTAAITSNFSYDSLNRLSELDNTYNETTDTYGYQYDANNNLTAITENNMTTNYAYDALDRLQLVDRTDINQQTGYGYDARGNKTKMEGYIPYALVSHDRDKKRNYTYNTLNQLVAFDVQIYNDISDIKYDYKGLRISKDGINGVTNYYYDNTGRTIAEMNGYGELKAQVVWGHKPLVRIIDGQYYYYLYNGHGDVVQVVDENGNIVNSYKYDEWGNTLEEQESIQNPIRYAGEYYDEESGLYYLRARCYDPTVGRFITRDTYEGQLTNPLSMNLYAYCRNNPMTRIDPSGYADQDLINTGGGGSFADILAIYISSLLSSPDFSRDLDTLAYDISSGNTSGAIIDGIFMLVPAIPGGLGKLTGESIGSVWDLNPFKRGNVIERMLGGMCNNFPVIDYFELGDEGVATLVKSIKSLNTNAKSYQGTNAIYKQVMSYAKKLADFGDTKWGGIEVDVGNYTKRVLEIAVPKEGFNGKVLEQFMKIVTDAKSKYGIDVSVQLIE